MDRRQFLVAFGSLPAALVIPNRTARLLAAPAALPMETKWRVTTSEGLDAVAFTGALSGGELYLDYYSKEAAEFGGRLPAGVREDLARLRQEAEASGFGLLWPALSTIFSGADSTTLDAIIAGLSNPNALLRPALQASPLWSEADWNWFSAAATRLRAIFAAMRDAGFPAYRNQLIGDRLQSRASELQQGLADYDVIRWQQKLSGKKLDPAIDIVLLYFSKPHGVRVQGQRFLQSSDYNLTTTLRIAAHELLHPPVDMKGKVGKDAVALLSRDPLISRIVREHDPRWGYTSVEGYLNEDICQALDQMISEAMGFGRNAADRWNQADDGMHVLAAGLYGLLRRDRWTANGGSIEEWLRQAIVKGRLSPESLHGSAAGVLERPVGKLWTPSKKSAPGRCR